MGGLFESLPAARSKSSAPVARRELATPHRWSALSGLRVLVVEDSFLVAEVIAETLEEGGCDVVGPIARVAQALPIARREPLNGAVLDINLAGEFSFPVAEALAKRGVPFLFLTGYGDLAVLPSRLRQITVVHKPFSPDELIEATAARFGRAAQPRAQDPI